MTSVLLAEKHIRTRSITYNGYGYEIVADLEARTYQIEMKLINNYTARISTNTAMFYSHCCAIVAVQILRKL